jgi:hypothetical protein
LSVLSNIAEANLLLASRQSAAGSACAPDPLLERTDLLLEADVYSWEAYHNAPWVPQFKGTRGCTLVELGKPKAGRSLLRAALEESEEAENQALGHCYLALAEHRLGNAHEARQFLAQARRLDPSCIALPRVSRELDRGADERAAMAGSSPE